MNLYRKTLVLLHGHGIDDSIWDKLDAEVNDTYTVVRPNISLFTSCQSVEEYAEELHRFLTNANIQKCCLIGHSMGGYIALAFAEKYPDMLIGLGLFHSTAFADDEAKKHQRNQTIELLKNHGTEAFIKNAAPNMFGEKYKEQHAENVRNHIEYFKKLPAEALISGLVAMRKRPDRTAILESVPFPVLFIIGMQDKLIPFEGVLNLSEYPKKGFPFILSEAAHMGMIESPDATARIIRWYMDKI